jgi:hypothetical protein
VPGRKRPGRRSGAAKKQQREGENDAEAKHVRQRHERIRGAEGLSAGFCGEACHGTSSSEGAKRWIRGGIAGEGRGWQGDCRRSISKEHLLD